MKLRPVTKPKKRNKATSKKINDDVISKNCDVIVIFLIYGRFGAFRKPDSGRIVVKLTFSFIVTFYLTKAENKAKKFLTSSHTIALSKGTIFAKNANFLQKEILTSAKLKEPWY